MAGLETHYSASDIEARILAALRAAGLDPEQQLSPEALAALDHFHTGGLRASRELMEMAAIRAEHRVLDIGAGLAGPARLIAFEHGCHVDCIEPSRDFCTGAALLNRLTGLDGRVKTHEGSALDLPFADKETLYCEIHRVLRPGGRYAFQEMAAGADATTYFPLPWATDPADSLLVSTEEMCAMLGAIGFIAEVMEDTGDDHLSRTAKESAPSPLSLGVYVENLKEKSANARRSLEEGQIRLVRGVFRAA